MTNNIISGMTQFGFQSVTPYVSVGTWKNYAVTLRQITRQSCYVYLAVRLGKANSRLRKTLREAVKAAGMKRAVVNSVQANTVMSSFSFGRDGTLSELTAFLELLTAALRENGVGPANTCAVTGAPNPDSLCMLQRQSCYGYQPVCAAAVRKETYAVQEKVEENENNGSYLTGAVGAVLGAILGIGVNVLTILFLERIFSLLFALVPIGAMFGYKLFKGKTNKFSLLIVIVLSLLAVPVMIYLSTALSFVRELKAPFGDALRVTGEIFFTGAFLREILGDLLKMLVFMALGVVFAWGYMREQLNVNRLQGANVHLESLRPNPLFAPAAGAAAPEAEAPAEQNGEETEQR